MAKIEFSGFNWRVVEVADVRGTRDDGTLYFMSRVETRRLTAFPRGWVELPEGILRSLCRRADPLAP